MSLQENGAYQLLKSVSADTIARKQGHVVTLGLSNSIEYAINILSHHKILSAPVLQDSDDKEPVAFVDVHDLATHVATLRTAESKDAIDLRAVKLRDVLNASSKRPFVTLYDNVTLDRLAELFARGVHRTALFSPGKPERGRTHESFAAVFSQSDLVAYLASKTGAPEMEFINKQTLTRLGYTDKVVTSVTNASSVFEGLIALASSGTSHLAVVDESGKLIANFGPQCLRGINGKTINDLDKPICEFLASNMPAWLKPNISRPDTTFGEQLKFFADNHAHHVWMVDDDGHPAGIITLSDIMQCIVNFKMTDSEKRAVAADKNATALKLPGSLFLRVMSASQLPSKFLSTVDPYVRIKFPGDSGIHQTPVVKANTNPKFDKSFTFALTRRIRGNYMSVEVWNANQFTPDQIVGTARIAIDWILDGFGTGTPLMNVQSDFPLVGPDGEHYGAIYLDLTYEGLVSQA